MLAALFAPKARVLFVNSAMVATRGGIEAGWAACEGKASRGAVTLPVQSWGGRWVRGERKGKAGRGTIRCSWASVETPTIHPRALARRYQRCPLCGSVDCGPSWPAVRNGSGFVCLSDQMVSGPQWCHSESRMVVGGGRGREGESLRREGWHQFTCTRFQLRKASIYRRAIMALTIGDQ